MAQGLPSRTFSTLAEFEDAAESATKEALIATLKHFKRELRDMVIAHIYNNVYKAKWYKRTNWLKEEDAIEDYIYKNTKNAIGGGLRFNREEYDEFSEPFQHGNPIHYLPMNSYLEIMNNSSLLPKGKKNVFHFPTSNEIDRGSFYTDFLKLLDDNKKGFNATFDIMWNNIMNTNKTGKPSILGITPRNIPTSRSGATSSSTSHIPSYHSSNV